MKAKTLAILILAALSALAGAAGFFAGVALAALTA